MKKSGLSVLAFLLFGGTLGAAPFTPGDVAAYRIGDGVSSTLSSAAAAVFIDEYTPSGTFVQSIALPSTGGSTVSFTGAGSTSSEGELTLSTDGRFLVFGGYGADAGTANVTGTTAPRVVGVLDVNTLAVDTTTRLTSTSTFSGNNFRGVASQDGSAFWLAGNGSTGNQGVRYATLGATTSSTISSTVNSTRAVGIYNGQLYMSAAAGVYTVGSGVPTTSGQTATLLPPGSEFTASVNYTGFYLTPDGSRLFVANGAATNSIQEFAFNAGNWSLDKTLTVTGASFQLTGMTLGNNTTLFYTLNSGSTQNTLNMVTFNSTTDSFGSSSLVATAGTGYSFKGVALINAVPEPSSTGLLAGGLLLAAAQFLRRRRR